MAILDECCHDDEKIILLLKKERVRIHKEEDSKETREQDKVITNILRKSKN